MLHLPAQIVQDVRPRYQPEKLLAVLEKAKDAGLLLGKGGMAGNTIRIKPPLCFTKENADFTVDVLDEALKA